MLRTRIGSPSKLVVLVNATAIPPAREVGWSLQTCLCMCGVPEYTRCNLSLCVCLTYPNDIARVWRKRISACTKRIRRRHRRRRTIKIRFPCARTGFRCVSAVSAAIATAAVAVAATVDVHNLNFNWDTCVYVYVCVPWDVNGVHVMYLG